jgi:hypothetical protein
MSEGASYFNCLTRGITYASDKAFHEEINKYDRLCFILRKTLKTKISKEAQLKLFKMAALPTLLFVTGSFIINIRN